MRCEIVPAVPDHAHYMGYRLSDITQEDVERVGVAPRILLEESIRAADYAWTGIIDDEIVCIWGVRAGSVIDNNAYLWMIAGTLLEEHVFVFIRKNQIFLKEVLEHYSCIHGFVGVNNHRSIRWLKWLGFDVSDDEVSEGLRYFEMRKK